jgi:hypothetical protein
METCTIRLWHFSQGPSNLHLGSESENLGPLFIANSSSGSRSRIAAGQLQSKAFDPLCDPADETIQHILIGCVFAWQVWIAIFSVLGLLPFAPTPEDSHFSSWWSKIIKAVPKEIKNGLNYLCCLGDVET